MGPCDRCASYKISCDRFIPCKRCGTKHVCLPSIHEVTSKARQILKFVKNGDFVHNDHIKYQLNLQSNLFGSKNFLGRSETKDIFLRISKMNYPSMEYIPMGMCGKLPDKIKYHVGDHSMYKIEWMFNGRYMINTSEEYGDNFMKDWEILSIATKYDIPPKIVDHCHLNYYDMAFQMWSDSVFNAGMPITYIGTALWKKEKEVVLTKISMMSILINHEYIITSTTCEKYESKSKMYIFGKTKIHF